MDKLLDPLIPLLTVDEEEDDFSAADRAVEIEQLYKRNQAISNCFYGEMSASDLLDLIEAHGIDPMEYILMAEANMALVMSSSFSGC